MNSFVLTSAVYYCYYYCKHPHSIATGRALGVCVRSGDVALFTRRAAARQLKVQLLLLHLSLSSRTHAACVSADSKYRKVTNAARIRNR